MSDTDFADTLIAKSDQLNADDLIGRTLTITVVRVQVDTAAEQPVVIHYEHDEGRPYKPGLSMRRVLGQVWGTDGAVYVGRRMTLYRDPTITFGKLAVGGLRISHLSHIDEPRTIALTAKQGSKKAFTVRPMPDAGPQQPQADRWEVGTAKLIGQIAACPDSAALRAKMQVPAVIGWRLDLERERPDLAQAVATACITRQAVLDGDTGGDQDEPTPEQVAADADRRAAAEAEMDRLAMGVARGNPLDITSAG